jgi:putative ABC transport system ATP-binding protein
MMGGLLHPDKGSVFLNKQDLFSLHRTHRAKQIGFVFQRFHLVPYLTVEENIQVAGTSLGQPVDQQRVDELLNQFNLTSRRRHVPGKLSVGEQQRTALARALYNRPLALLADEPTGNLDPDNANVVLHALADFAHQGGTVIMVTHHPEAAARADRCWWIKNHKLQEK